MTALFVLGVIVFLLVLDLGVRVLSPRGAPAAVPVPAFAANVMATKGRFYARGHTWAAFREDGEVLVGVDDFARAALGAADDFEVLPTGTKVERGQPLLTAVKGDRRLVFPSPLSGTVGEAAQRREGGGDHHWLLSLDPSRIGSEIKSLLVGEEAAAWVKNEVARFREFVIGGLSPQVAASLPDGGEPVEGALDLLPDQAWHEFEAEFLARR